MEGNDPIAFIQARMNSSRYPGKSLAPLDGIPVIKRVIDRVNKSRLKCDVVVLTTDEQADDPLASYLADQDVTVFRGHPTNVFKRFRSALDEYSCNSFFRICGDHPFLEPDLFERAIKLFEQEECDIVTNVHEINPVAGKVVELINTKTFQKIDIESLSEKEQEHVTVHFYEKHKKYDIKNIHDPKSCDENEGYAVNTLEDLKRMERQLIDTGTNRQ